MLNGLPRKWTKIFCCLPNCTQILHFRLFCWLWGLLHFFSEIPGHSSGYNVQLNSISPFPSILVHWFLRCSCSPLAISCLIMSNLPWFMDLTFQGPTQYCSLQHRILLSPPDTSTTGCRSCFVPTASFFLELLVIALCSSPVVYWTLSDLGGSSPLGVSYLFAFSCCSWGSSGKNTGVVCHSLLQWTTFCQNSSLWPICLGWTCTAWLRAPLSYEAPSPVKGYDPWMGSISWVLSTQLLSK